MSGEFWFFIGLAIGGAVMWFHFWSSDLIRTRREYYEAHPELKPKDEK